MSNLLDKLRKRESSNFEKMKKHIKDQESTRYNNADADEYWYPSTDKSGDGFAVVRFLTTDFKFSDDVNSTQIFSHFFKGPGGWFVENSLTTIGKDDPVSEYNSKLWNTELEENRKQASRQKRKQNFIANIYVVHDTVTPENEGKVFKFKMGPKLWEKVKGKMFPNEKFGEEGVNVFSLFEGANFNIKIRRVDKQRNYDMSDFSASSVISHYDGTPLSEDEIETALNSVYSISKLTSESEFKSYDVLKAHLFKVLAIESEEVREDPKPQKSDVKEDLNEDDEFLKNMQNTSPPKEDDLKEIVVVDDEDDDMAVFRSLIA